MPVWSATQLGADGAVANGIGYEATDAEAQCSALGEAAEAAAAAAAIPSLPRTRGSFAALADHGAIDPVSLCLEAGTELSAERELTSCRPVRWRTGEPVLLPEAAVATSPSQLQDAPLFTPISNGLCASTR